MVEDNEEEADVSVSVVGSSVTSSAEDFELLVVIVVFEVVIGIELDGEDDEKDVVVRDVVVGDEVLEVEIGDVAGEEMVVDDLVVRCVVEGKEKETDVSVSVVGSSVTSSFEDFELLVVIVVFEVVIGIELDGEDDEKYVVVGDVVDGEEVLEVEIGDVAGEEMVVDDLVVCCVVEGNEEEADVSVSVVGSSVTSSVEDFELLVAIVVFEVVLGIELDGEDDEKDVEVRDVVVGDEVLEVEIGDVAGEEMVVDDLVVCCVVEGNEEETDVSVSVVGSSVTSSVEDFELLVVIVVFEVVIGIELDEEDDEKAVAVGDMVDGDEILEVEIGDVAGEEMVVDDLVVCCVVEGNEEETDVSVSVVGSSVISSVEDFELLVVIVVFEVVLGIELDGEDDEKYVVVGDVVDGDEVLEVEVAEIAEELEVDDLVVC